MKLFSKIWLFNLRNNYPFIFQFVIFGYIFLFFKVIMLNSNFMYSVNIYFLAVLLVIKFFKSINFVLFEMENQCLFLTLPIEMKIKVILPIVSLIFYSLMAYIEFLFADNLTVITIELISTILLTIIAILRFILLQLAHGCE